MRIYVSGPMSNLPDLNFPAFHEAARRLRALGFEVVNPAELNTDPGATWAQCMRVDIKALMDCDGVALLPDWFESRGASIERNLAASLGMKVQMLDDWLRDAERNQIARRYTA